MELGVHRAYWFLKRRACRHEQIILAGYSQGAIVMRRLFTDLMTSKQTRIVNRIARVTTLLNVGIDKARKYAITTRLAHSLCDAQDIVCDPHKDLTSMVNLAMSRAVARARLPIPQGDTFWDTGEGILLIRRAGEQDQSVWWYGGAVCRSGTIRGTRADVRAYYDVPPSGWGTTETFSAWITGGRLRTTDGAGALWTLPRSSPQRGARRRWGIRVRWHRNGPSRPGGWMDVNDVQVSVAECVDWFTHRRRHGGLTSSRPPSTSPTTGPAPHSRTTLTTASRPGPDPTNRAATEPGAIQAPHPASS